MGRFCRFIFVAVVALKEVLAARLDEDDEVLHSFLYDGALIWETALVRDLGFPTDGVAEICVVVDSRASFQWKHCTIGEGFISEDGATYHRGETSSTTNGVRAAAPLPRGARCHLTFKSVGSHACFGVGTKMVQLSERRYSSLYGQDEESWAVVFGMGEQTRAYHAKQEYQIQTRAAGLPLASHDRGARITNGGRDCILPVSFLLGDDGSLSFWLPGAADDTAGLEGADEEALVVPFNVPQDKRVYVVASTVYGRGMIAISQAPITPDGLIPKSLPPDQAEPEAGKSKGKGKRKGKGKGKGNSPEEAGKAKGKQKSKDNHETEAGKAKGKTAKSKDVGSAPQQAGKGKGKRKSKDTGHGPPEAGKAKSKGKSKEPPEAGKAKGKGLLTQ
eukprot:s2039_g6.t2